MDLSALPYLLYFFAKVVFILAFAVIGHIQRRALLFWVISWLLTGAARYALIVGSAGTTPLVARDGILWMIRLLVYVECVLFVASAIAFVVENVRLKRNAEKP
jgi:predicted membrane protein